MLRFVLLACLLMTPAHAETFAALRAARPELFHPDTGFRIDRQRAPTPDDIPPPARRVDAVAAHRLIVADAVAIDVYGAAQSRFDELDGTWLVRDTRQSLPGAVWLPEVGRGVLDDTMAAYLAGNLDRLTGGDADRAIVVFCVADCWMSWNAAQRIAALGYAAVYWFREGTDGWQDAGFPLEPVAPIPVLLD